MVLKKMYLKGMTTVALTSALVACGGGSSSSSSSKVDCVSFSTVPGGVNASNSCGYKVNVALFDPLFRFSLEGDEIKFLARTGHFFYGACKSPSKPKQKEDALFVCD